jgi:3-oxoacyl-[acyl-carrier protein] reductase
LLLVGEAHVRPVPNASVTGPALPAELAGREAFGRAAEPREVANVMVFLASDYAGYMTGEVVSVSGQHR